MNLKDKLNQRMRDEPIKTIVVSAIILTAYLFLVMFIPWCLYHLGAVGIIMSIAIDSGLIVGGLSIAVALGILD